MFHGEIGKIVLNPFCIFFAHVYVGILGGAVDIPVCRENPQVSPALRLQHCVILHIIKTNISKIVDIFYKESRYIKYPTVPIITSLALAVKGIQAFKLPEGEIDLFQCLYNLRFDIQQREFMEFIFTHIKATAAGMAEKNLAVIFSIEIGLAVLAFKTDQLTHFTT
jgi:hypothetical protein